MSGLPVTNDEGEVVANISASDIKTILPAISFETNLAFDLTQPVLKFLQSTWTPFAYTAPGGMLDEDTPMNQMFEVFFSLTDLFQVKRTCLCFFERFHRKGS